MGFERLIQVSGGHLFAAGLDYDSLRAGLRPVARLYGACGRTGGNTLIFAKGENANESLIHPFI